MPAGKENASVTLDQWDCFHAKPVHMKLELSSSETGKALPLTTWEWDDSLFQEDILIN